MIDEGVVWPHTATTDSTGKASAFWILGPTTGPQTVRASADSFSVDFTATATDPPDPSTDFLAHDRGDFRPAHLDHAAIRILLAHIIEQTIVE